MPQRCSCFWTDTSHPAGFVPLLLLRHERLPTPNTTRNDYPFLVQIKHTGSWKNKVIYGMFPRICSEWRARRDRRFSLPPSARFRATLASGGRACESNMTEHHGKLGSPWYGFPSPTCYCYVLHAQSKLNLLRQPEWR